MMPAYSIHGLVKGFKGWSRGLVCMWVAGAVSFSSCVWAVHSDSSVTNQADRAGIRDVTFIHISDQHYSADMQGDMLSPTIQAMNDIQGTAYPASIEGQVGRVRGVILTGDLTNSGLPEEWEKFVAQWGLTGQEGAIAYPVYEGAGNHDGGVSTADRDPAGYVRRQIIQRNTQRTGVTTVSPNGLHYAWDWADVHFVQLNEYAGQEKDQRYPGNVAYGRKRQSYGNPAQESLQFLSQDLASQVGRSGRPVILVQHYGLAGFPIHPWGDEAGWWTEEQALRLWEVIEGYNVIAILGGHDGTENVFDWHGIWNRLMDDDVRFGVYHVTDDRMTVAKRHARTGVWETHWTQSTQVNASLPPELVQGPYLIYNGRADEMTVCWRTRANVTCTLKWDDDQFFYKDGSVTVEPCNRDLHLYRYTLTGLKPNSSVNYTLEIHGKYAPGMFYAAPLGSDRVKFFMIGGQADLQTRDRLYRSLYDTLYRDPACHSMLVHTGAVHWDCEEVGAWDEALFSRKPDARHIRYTLSRLPIMRLSGQSALERQLFPYEDHGPGGYAFEYGPVHVAMVNFEGGISGRLDQLEWLKDDLESATAAWKCVVARPGQGRDSGEAWPEALQEVCRTHRVDICVWRGDVFCLAGQDRIAYLKTGHVGAMTASVTMAVQIEGDTLTCHWMDLDGAVVHTFTMRH